MKAVVYDLATIPRGRIVNAAMAEGIRRAGDLMVVRQAWNGKIEGQVAVAYGWHCREVMERYRQHGGSYVHLDMGYWVRKPLGNPRGGFHKVSVNAKHPTAYFRKGYPPDRFGRLGVRIKPWRQEGEIILLAGMSAKAARHAGHEPEAWERAMIKRLAPLGREIIYRPKPSWREAQPLRGTTFSPKTEALEAVLKRAWLVVTHHSNVAVDSVMEGVPVYAEDGVGSLLSMADPIGERVFPEDREGFAHDLAYCQWTPEEMRDGSCWRHLRDSGLLA